jgi:hypothetical protein
VQSRRWFASSVHHEAIVADRENKMRNAAELRDAVDPHAVEALIAAFPAPADVGCRQQFDKSLVTGKLPQNLDARLAALQARKVQQLDRLASEIHHYTELRSLGLAALSDYDCTISSGDDPFAGLHMAFSLKTAHISYANSALVALDIAIADTFTAIHGDMPQLGLF